ncbi:hypothetical protein WJX73_003279 [Symbiochloris irregularis]|uniref:Mitochondrial proton/calcium exchanger protein n=1 Tax=Symbiochloris irregularis TaxID=706552 RepID=A0AAW1NME6_9CHLO
MNVGFIETWPLAEQPLASTCRYGHWHAFHTAGRSVLAAQPAVAEDTSSTEQSGSQAQGASQQHAAAQHTEREAPDNEPGNSKEMAAELLKAAKERVERARAYGSETTLLQQLKNFAGVIQKAGLKAVNFLLSIPGSIMRFAAQSSAERRETYKGWWTTIKKEAYHYWMGTKLLGTEVSIATRLLWKTVNGKQLSRRERRQLTRTTADVFRLVPMAVFVLVPFMELLLPIVLRIFPNMLPSTFEDKLKKEEELKKRIGVKLEVARFLQDTVEEMAKDMSKSGAGMSGEMQASAKELYAFMKRVRAGDPVSNFEITRFAQLFNDELTLDNLERIHLVNLCRFVGIQPFGTDAFLAARLRSHLSTIKRDDRAIQEEGVDTLTEEELRSACRARGMRTPFGEGAPAFMQRQLREWLDLSLHRALPSSLLLLSRAFTVTAPLAPSPQGREYDSLKDTLSSLPEKVIAEVSMETHTEGVDPGEQYARKLEQLKREEALIHEEELEAEALVAEGSDGSQGATIDTSGTAQETTAAAAAAAVVREATASAAVEVLGTGVSAEEKASRLATVKEERMRKVISALSVLASSSGVSSEREAFMELVKSEIGRLNSQLLSQDKGGVSLVFAAGGVQTQRPKELEEVVGQQRLADKVSGILERIEADLDAVDTKIGESMHVLDLDNDGLVSKEELQAAMGFLREQLGEDELHTLLEQLNAWGDASDEPIPVAKLMKLARETPAKSTS